MKRIYEFITKANQILLFLAIIGATVLISYMLVSDFTRHDEPPHVLVAQTPNEAKQSIIEEARFLGQSSGIYMFAIVKHIIDADDKTGRLSLSMVTYLSSGEKIAGEMVNVVFSKGERRVKTLLKKDGLVLDLEVSGNYRSEKFNAMLFRCVTEDTDGNHRLDKMDRNDLYVVSAGLEKPDLVLEGVLDFDVISPTHLVVKTGTGNDQHFWDVDTETQTKRELAWK
jgi:hypothetical protein